MDHYLEIKILPDPEFAPTLLMNALYSKLHRALAQLGCTDIGLSFPAYIEEKSLGDRIRLHSTQKRLEELMNTNWLTGMNDHIRIGPINPVPSQIHQHAIFRRVQTTSNVERIRRRQMIRHNWSYEQALEKIPNSVEKRLKHPFVTIKSRSTDQTFRLFIKQEKVPERAQGSFNAYGLSKGASVPAF